MHNRNRFRGCIDEVDHPVIAYPNPPKIFVPSQLIAPQRPRIVGQREDLPIYPGEQRIVKRVQFLQRRLLDVERKVRHANVCALLDSRGIARKECFSPSVETQLQDRPGSPPKGLHIVSGRFERPPCGPFRL